MTIEEFPCADLFFVSLAHWGQFLDVTTQWCTHPAEGNLRMKHAQTCTYQVVLEGTTLSFIRSLLETYGPDQTQQVSAASCSGPSKRIYVSWTSICLTLEGKWNIVLPFAACFVLDVKLCDSAIRAKNAWVLTEITYSMITILCDDDHDDDDVEPVWCHVYLLPVVHDVMMDISSYIRLHLCNMFAYVKQLMYCSVTY